MHIISQERYNPKKGCVDRYYRIKESYRDALGKVHSYVLLNVGFLEGFLPSEIGDIARGLIYQSIKNPVKCLLLHCRDTALLFVSILSDFGKKYLRVDV